LKKENPAPKRRTGEFQYLEDANEEEQAELQTHNYGLIDMGKIRIITMLNNANGKIFKHTRRDEIRQTKRLKITNKIQILRDKMGILELEQNLSKHNGRTCNIPKYSSYLRARNNVLNNLSEKYSLPQFRRLNFHLYNNKTRARDKLVTKIKNFMADITPPTSSNSITTNIRPILIFGNWSANKNMKHMISTPGVGLKRFLLKHFKSYDIDEFRTSIINHKTNTYGKNLYLHNEKIHSVLTYKMENKRLGCINRDRNAVLNMKKIVENILEMGEYPYVFRRSTPANSVANPSGNTQEEVSNSSKSIPIILTTKSEGNRDVKS
jgi:hypothetical protein